MCIVKLPGGDFINLALIQQVEIDKDPLLVLVHWSGWDSRTAYTKADAEAIIEVMTNQCIDFSDDETT